MVAEQEKEALGRGTNDGKGGQLACWRVRREVKGEGGGGSLSV